MMNKLFKQQLENKDWPYNMHLKILDIQKNMFYKQFNRMEMP